MYVSVKYRPNTDAVWTQPYPQPTFALLKQPAITSVEVISRSQLDHSAWRGHFVNSAGIILFVTDEMNWSNCLTCSLSANWLLKYNLEADMPFWHFLCKFVPVKSQFVLALGVGGGLIIISDYLAQKIWRFFFGKGFLTAYCEAGAPNVIAYSMSDIQTVRSRLVLTAD